VRVKLRRAETNRPAERGSSVMQSAARVCRCRPIVNCESQRAVRHELPRREAGFAQRGYSGYNLRS
jgi:hypothetical protein